jgi:hypothetical protein
MPSGGCFIIVMAVVVVVESWAEPEDVTSPHLSGTAESKSTAPLISTLGSTGGLYTSLKTIERTSSKGDSAAAATATARRLVSQ